VIAHRAFERAYKAARTLALSSEPLRKRLEQAYVYELSTVEPDDFGHLETRALALRTALTWAPCPVRGSIVNTIALMSDDEVRRVAGLLADFCHAVALAEGVQHHDFYSRSTA
jgi:hypothetical protein